MSQQNMNQQSKKRKISPDNIPPIGEDPLKKKNKFNIYWIYGIIFISIIAFQLFRGVSSAGIEINPVHYQEILKAGDVQQDIPLSIGELLHLSTCGASKIAVPQQLQPGTQVLGQYCRSCRNLAQLFTDLFHSICP